MSDFVHCFNELEASRVGTAKRQLFPAPDAIASKVLRGSCDHAAKKSALNEDAHHARTKNAPANLAIFRPAALTHDQGRHIKGLKPRQVQTRRMG